MTLTDRPSPNHGERRPAGGDAVAIDMLVIHYTGMVPDAKALDWMCDPASSVSAHYFIDEAGAVCRLVPEERRAWHAGVSAWRGARVAKSLSPLHLTAIPNQRASPVNAPPPKSRPTVNKPSEIGTVRVMALPT